MRELIRIYLMVVVVLMMGCARTGGEAGGNDGPVDRFTSTGVETFAEGSEMAQALMSTEDGDAEDCEIGEQSQGLRHNGGTNISCSSKDGSMDCFCSAGCCRTKTTCTCCGSSLTWGGVDLETVPSTAVLTY